MSGLNLDSEIRPEGAELRRSRRTALIVTAILCAALCAVLLLAVQMQQVSYPLRSSEQIYQSLARSTHSLDGEAVTVAGTVYYSRADTQGRGLIISLPEYRGHTVYVMLYGLRGKDAQTGDKVKIHGRVAFWEWDGDYSLLISGNDSSLELVAGN